VISHVWPGFKPVLAKPGFERHYQIHPNMIVCLCHAVTDRDIDRVIEEGAATVEEIGRQCGAGTGCGACVMELHDKLCAHADDLASLSSGSARCSRGLVSVRSRKVDLARGEEPREAA
jgi:bacterioferritin-associated ferredoxin